MAADLQAGRAATQEQRPQRDISEAAEAPQRAEQLWRHQVALDAQRQLEQRRGLCH
ncbi:hypothetical protein [Curtobacterium sp. MCSS17_016]|uniref:hypothetical protein n=1 Tax=Curtobacterium sp. MCSS17_016 TaxID=2175644 RepID=UPI0024DF4060|nr:hypothetical protein [Curtobacterium sp. MCSS17_016]